MQGYHGLKMCVALLLLNYIKGVIHMKDKIEFAVQLGKTIKKAVDEQISALHQAQGEIIGKKAQHEINSRIIKLLDAHIKPLKGATNGNNPTVDIVIKTYINGELVKEDDLKRYPINYDPLTQILDDLRQRLKTEVNTNENR